MPRLPLSFVRCVDCGHVFNREFDYRQVPYSDKPNLMFNRAAIWQGYLREVRDTIIAQLPKDPVVVEIGCGEGHLLRDLARALPGGRYVGFDPHGTLDTADGKVEVRRELFEPAVHLAEYRPDLVVSRHVLEHMMNPLRFLQRLSFAAEWFSARTLLFLEVPCIDRVFTSGRIADFYYEHNSHFTTRSFTSLLRRLTPEILLLEHGYNGEVITGLVELGTHSQAATLGREALTFRDQAVTARARIRQQLAEIHASGQTLALWGGTGKGAAFINYFGVDAQRFPLVVDSDPDKVGTYVPGASQLIRFRDYLLEHPADIIIIPTQWRANDIVTEMQQTGIRFQTALIEHHGRLVDYFADEHPYR